MTISVRLNLRGFVRARTGTADAIDRGAKRAAGFVGDLAQQLAPEETGALKASKHVEQRESGVYTVSFGRGLPDARAIYQEYGTGRMAAQPYLTPALRQINVTAEIAKELRDLVRG